MKQRPTIISCIIYIPLIERYQLTVSYYSYLILSYHLNSTFFFLSCVLSWRKLFFFFYDDAPSEKSIALKTTSLETNDTNRDL